MRTYKTNKRPLANSTSTFPTCTDLDAKKMEKDQVPDAFKAGREDSRNALIRRRGACESCKSRKVRCE